MAIAGAVIEESTRTPSDDVMHPSVQIGACQKT